MRGAMHGDTDQRLRALRTMNDGKAVPPADAVQLIRSGDTRATGGFVGIGFPENIAVALEKRFLESARTAPTASASRAT